MLYISGPTTDGELLFWSNDIGWVSKDTAPMFTYDEINDFIARRVMPIGAGPIHDRKGEV